MSNPTPYMTSEDLSFGNIQMARDMKNSPMWNMAVSEIDRKIHFEMQKLKACTPEELKEIQCKIMAYESVKNLPQDIEDRESQ